LSGRILEPHASDDHGPRRYKIRSAHERSLTPQTDHRRARGSGGRIGPGRGRGLAKRYGLIPPDHAGFYGPGETLTYAAQRILTKPLDGPRVSSQRDFEPSVRQRSGSVGDEFKRLQDGGFADWRLAVDGMVARPASFSLAELKSHPSRSQITHLACEEGWSYIAEWTGVPLSHVLDLVGSLPQARYVVYFSIQRDWWDSIDMADACIRRLSSPTG
jgi:hypothetical protein